jgi:hypothetical protein
LLKLDYLLNGDKSVKRSQDEGYFLRHHFISEEFEEVQTNLTLGSEMDGLPTGEQPQHKHPAKRKRLFATFRFLLFAAAIGLFLAGLKILLSKIPITASLLRHAEAGTVTASLMLHLDGIGFIAVVCLSALAARTEGLPFGAFGLPIRDAFRKRFVQGVLWGLVLAFLDIGCTYLLGGFSFGALALLRKRF